MQNMDFFTNVTMSADVERMAGLLKIQYDAFIAVGFNEKQALELTIAMIDLGFKNMKGQNK